MSERTSRSCWTAFVISRWSWVSRPSRASILARPNEVHNLLQLRHTFYAAPEDEIANRRPPSE